ncbi:MAG: SDR family oxidoreductase [Candidatus Woesearchaeota archaeon]
MIIITGASEGIGKETAKLFYENKKRVLATSRNLKKLEKLPKEITKKELDVTKEEQVKEVFKNIKKIDCLVCNAGVGHFSELEKTTTKKYDEMFQTNVKGVFLTLKYALPILKKQGKGQIIVISSMAGINPVPGASIYASTKWAIQGMITSLKQELRDTKIKVSLVLPGSVKTKFFEKAGIQRSNKRILKPKTIAQNIFDIYNQPKDCDLDQIIIRPSNN